MRPTKSRKRKLYHKSLRSLERKKWELEKKARNSSEYIEIPKTLAGYKMRLVLIDSLRNNSAKKYFVQRLDDFDRNHKPVFKYEPVIPRTYVREVEEKIFWNALRIPDSQSEYEAKRIGNHLDYKKEVADKLIKSVKEIGWS